MGLNIKIILMLTYLTVLDGSGFDPLHKDLYVGIAELTTISF